MLAHNWQVEHPQGFNDYSPFKKPQSKTFPDKYKKENFWQALNQYFHAVTYTHGIYKEMLREREGIK